MNITLNGKQKDISSSCTVTQLLASLELPAETLVVELNTTIIQPDSYSATNLSEEIRWKSYDL